MRVTIDINGTACTIDGHRADWNRTLVEVGFGSNMIELTFSANGERQGVRIPKADWLGIAGLVREREG